MFVDRAQIRVRGGNGGNGCVSFRRERRVRFGGPDGGHGGHGGDVILLARARLNTLEAMYYLNHYEGESGLHGSSNTKHGRNGEDKVIEVPAGTLVHDLDRDGELLADLDHDGARLVVARGGRGGRGNSAFVSSVNQAPRNAEEGTEGEEHHLGLELKIVADVGLVGYPNAGKSTLLGALTNAHPAVAPYPFTTVTPHVGTVQDDDFFTYTIADIPGLVDGAHQNVGLGHDFLRHIERTRVLLYVLDTAGIDGRTPWDDLAALQRELECYQPGLTDRPAVVVANKIDESAAAANLERLRGHTELPVVPFCAVLGEDSGPLLARIRRLVESRGGGRHPA